MTTTGGGAAMAVDQLGVRGVAVDGPTDDTLARLANAGVVVAPGRIVDLTLAGTKYAVMKAALDVLLSAPEFDLILAVPGSSARFDPELAVRPVIDSAGGSKPLAAFVVPDAPEALARLTAAGVPSFRTPEACADAIAAAFSRRPGEGRGPIASAPAFAGATRILDELQAYDLLATLGIPHAAAEAIDGQAAATTIEYPVAVKILSAQVPHKTDVGGVVLGVRDAAGLREAMARIGGSVAAAMPGVKVERFLVQSMARGVGEALVGYRHDAQVGPIVMLAAGGVLAEIHRDRAIRMAPVDLEGAREMVAEVRTFVALGGYRGRAAGDLEALARAVAALSNLALAPQPVLEAEVNPLLVLEDGQGVIAVDALVRMA